MSRHRNVRSMNYEDEYYDDDDDYSRSYEDNYCISPGTVAQFTWNRERNTNLASYMGADDVINEVEVEEYEDQEDSSLHDSLNVSQARSNLSDTDQARLNSCLEEIHNIMGETVPESIMVDAILRNQFSVEKSLNELLTPQDAPKPQRQPRIRNRSQDDCEDTNELNKLLADIQSLESLAKPEYHTPSLLRFKSNPGSDEINDQFENLYLSSSSGHTTTKYEDSCLLKDEAPKNTSLVSTGSSSMPLQKERERTTLQQPKISLTDLAQQSNSLQNTKKHHCMNDKSLNTKTSDSGKVSLAQLAKLSTEKKGTQNKASKDVDSTVSDLSKVLDKNLSVQSSHDESGKLSLSDLAKQHKSFGECSQDRHKMKLGESSSAFLIQHLAGKRDDKSSFDQKKSSDKSIVSLAQENTINNAMLGTPPSNTSLSELANRHKTSLQSALGVVMKDSKLGALSVLSRVKTVSVSRAQRATESKSSAKVNSAEKSLTKLSLTSCLRNSKKITRPLGDEKTVRSSEALGDLNDITSVTGFKENKDFTPVYAIESIDVSLVSSPSSSAVVFCETFGSEQSQRGIKRKMNYPSFACHEQIKKRRVLYPQFKLHKISSFNFSTLSPDDIVKEKQKRAFMRSDKEFNIGDS